MLSTISDCAGSSLMICGDMLPIADDKHDQRAGHGAHELAIAIITDSMLAFMYASHANDRFYEPPSLHEYMSVLILSTGWQSPYALWSALCMPLARKPI